MRPQALAALEHVGLILHAGDIGSPEVLEALRRIAPLRAVRGNNDRTGWARVLPLTDTVTVATSLSSRCVGREIVTDCRAARNCFPDSPE
jgi:predicted phosphodiesterase